MKVGGFFVRAQAGITTTLHVLIKNENWPAGAVWVSIEQSVTVCGAPGAISGHLGSAAGRAHKAFAIGRRASPADQSRTRFFYLSVGGPASQ